MKKVLLVLLLNMVLIVAYSQSFMVFYDGEPISHMAKITVKANPGLENITLDGLEVKNMSDDTLHVICKRDIMGNKTGSVNFFCWAGECYSPETDIALKVDTIKPKTFSSGFFSEYVSNGFRGIFSVKYTFYDAQNPENSVAVIVDYDASDSKTSPMAKPKSQLIRAYPNPANNFLSVDYQLQEITDSRFVIHNLLGTKVKEVEIKDTSGTLKINTTDFIEGIYFYSLLINHEVSQTHKLIINH